MTPSSVGECLGDYPIQLRGRARKEQSRFRRRGIIIVITVCVHDTSAFLIRSVRAVVGGHDGVFKRARSFFPRFGAIVRASFRSRATFALLRYVT